MNVIADTLQLIHIIHRSFIVNVLCASSGQLLWAHSVLGLMQCFGKKVGSSPVLGGSLQLSLSWNICPRVTKTCIQKYCGMNFLARVVHCEFLFSGTQSDAVSSSAQELLGSWLQSTGVAGSCGELAMWLGHLPGASSHGPECQKHEALLGFFSAVLVDVLKQPLELQHLRCRLAQACSVQVAAPSHRHETQISRSPFSQWHLSNPMAAALARRLSSCRLS